MRDATPARRDEWTPEFWRRYAESDNPFRRYKLERDRQLALELLRPADGERILEAGCGYGRISRALLDAGRIRLFGVDRSASMLAASREIQDHRFTRCQAEAGRLPFADSSFDAALCSGVLMHLDDQRAALAELARVVHPGGRLVVSGNNLLSPFALPVKLWGLLRGGPRQDFRSPWFYRRELSRLGLVVQRTIGDTLLAVAMQVPGGERPLLPAGLLPALRLPDRWAARAPFNCLAYEVWFLATKPG